jgi:hypothetical protein
MSISEMSDDDRAELFLVLGDVRGEIKDLRDASKTLRKVVVPRQEHDARRRFTLALFFVGILLAMNIHDIHIQHCMGPAHLQPGGATWIINTCWTFFVVRVARREAFESGRLRGHFEANQGRDS